MTSLRRSTTASWSMTSLRSNAFSWDDFVLPLAAGLLVALTAGCGYGLHSIATAVDLLICRPARAVGRGLRWRSLASRLDHPGHPWRHRPAKCPKDPQDMPGWR